MYKQMLKMERRVRVGTDARYRNVAAGMSHAVLISFDVSYFFLLSFTNYS